MNNYLNEYGKVEFTLNELESMETISSGHFDDLKFETKYIRVWLSRMTIEDGMEYNNQVTIETLKNGVWRIKKQYEAIV